MRLGSRKKRQGIGEIARCFLKHRSKPVLGGAGISQVGVICRLKIHLRFFLSIHHNSRKIAIGNPTQNKIA